MIRALANLTDHQWVINLCAVAVLAALVGIWIVGVSATVRVWLDLVTFWGSLLLAFYWGRRSGHEDYAQD